MKACTTCHVDKPLDAFRSVPRGKLGLKAQCRTCESARRVAWGRANKDKERARNSRWARKNLLKVYAYQKQWRAENAEKYAAYQARHAEARRDVFAARCAKRKAQKLRATPLWADSFIIGEAYALARLRTDLVSQTVIPLPP